MSTYKVRGGSTPKRWVGSRGRGWGVAVGCTGYIKAECTTKRNVHGRTWVLEKLSFDIEDSETFAVVEKNTTAGKDIPHLLA